MKLKLLIFISLISQAIISQNGNSGNNGNSANTNNPNVTWETIESDINYTAGKVGIGMIPAADGNYVLGVGGNTAIQGGLKVDQRIYIETNDLTDGRGGTLSVTGDELLIDAAFMRISPSEQLRLESTEIEIVSPSENIIIQSPSTEIRGGLSINEKFTINSADSEVGNATFSMPGDELLISAPYLKINPSETLQLTSSEIDLSAGVVTLSTDETNIVSKNGLNITSSDGNISMVTNEIVNITGDSGVNVEALSGMKLNSSESSINIYGDQGVTINSGGDTAKLIGENIDLDSSIVMNVSSGEDINLDSGTKVSIHGDEGVDLIGNTTIQGDLNLIEGENQNVTMDVDNVKITGDESLFISGERGIKIQSQSLINVGTADNISITGDQNVSINGLEGLALKVSEEGNITMNTNQGGILLTAGGDTVKSSGDDVWLAPLNSAIVTGVDFDVRTDRFTVTSLEPKFTNSVAIATDIVENYKLAVGGKIVAEELKVALQGSAAWPDYVFAKDYKLTPLTEVEKHIQEKGHLENIPSAVQVQKEGGIHVGEMNIKLLEKIEELTLYTIQQEKALKAQEAVNADLQKRLSKLEALLSK